MGEFAMTTGAPAGTPRTRSGQWWVVMVAAAGVGALALGLTVAEPAGGPGMVQALSLISYLAGPAFGGMAAAARARRADTRPDRWSWRLVTATAGCWLAGNAIYTGHVLADGAPPFPSAADPFWLAAPVLLMAAHLLFPVTPAGRLAWSRVLVEVGMVAGSLLLVWWVVVLRPVLATTAVGTLGGAVLVAYPVLDVALATTSLTLLVRSRGRDRALLGVLAVSAAAYAGADSLWTVGVLSGAPTPQPLSTIGRYVGYVGLGVAAAMPRSGVARRTGSAVATSRMAYAAPILALAVVLGDHLRDTDPVVVLLVAAVALLAAARQVLGTRDALGLARQHAARAATERRRRRQAEMRDALTGAATRAVLMQRLTRLLALQDRAQLPAGKAETAHLAVLVTDIDGLDRVNQTWGHEAGDRLLRTVQQRLASTVRTGDTLARVGGDEFAVLAPGLASDPATADAQAAAVAARVTEALRGLHPSSVVPEAAAGRSVQVRIGYTTTVHSGPDAEDLLRDAHTALQQAKQRRQHRARTPVLYRPEMRDAVRDQAALTTDLAEALDTDEQLSLHYQPIVEVGTGRVVAVEALARWRHPHRGLVAPVRFVAAAETAGLIGPLGQRLLDRACRDLATWRTGRTPAHDLVVAVNVSPMQLAEAGFPDVVAAALDRHRLPGDALRLEITESAIAEDLRPAAAALRGLGVQLSIDDFGTAYSSLTRLRDLPFDELKIDRTFVQPAAEQPHSRRLLQAVVALGHAVGMTVVAEGVETAEQLQLVRDLGCNLAQGYLLGRPTAAEDITGRLASRADDGRVAARCHPDSGQVTVR